MIEQPITAPTNALPAMAETSMAKEASRIAENSSATPRPIVLVADDDPVARRLAQKCLLAEGYDFVEAANGQEAVDRMSESVYVALLDINMPELSGFDCLREIRSRFPDTHVIMITASDDVADAVTAIKEGASEYILKPLQPDALLAHVRKAVSSSQLNRDNRELRSAVSHTLPTSAVSSKSESYAKLLEQVTRLANLESTVLITGESGTGKTTLARMIHQSGDRATGPFVSVNCASLPRDLIEAELFGHEKGAFTGAMSTRPGRVEIADGGTIFLDEIGDLPLELQPKLLTFLQERSYQRIGSNRERHVNVRVIAATHQDLNALCENKRFRPDLHYRLNVLALYVPSIRERAADIPVLAQELVTRLSRKLECATPNLMPDTLQKMFAYSWPGNIREMENVLERAIAFRSNDELIQPQDLDFGAAPAQAATGPNGATSLAGMTLAEIEKLAIQQTLSAYDGNKAMSARQLGISEKSIYNKLKRHGIFENHRKS